MPLLLCLASRSRVSACPANAVTSCVPATVAACASAACSSGGNPHASPAPLGCVIGDQHISCQRCHLMCLNQVFFSRISKTIVLKSGILKAEIRIKMGDVIRRGASTILAPFHTSEGTWIRASAVSSNKVVVVAAQRNASRPF
eukprot:217175-Pelagomonas_calceolata.AAC.2